MKCVYSVGKEYLAELFKQVLTDNKIEAFIINRKDSSYHFGYIDVLVHPEDINKAKSLVDEFENNTSIE